MRRYLLVLIAVCAFAGCGASDETTREQPATDIWSAAATGNGAVIEEYIASGGEVDAKDPVGGGSPLIVAALYGQVEAAELLIENGASVNAKNNDKATALHVAAFFCYPEVVALLLEHGADLELENSFGSTPLETVSGEWTGDVERMYDMVAGLWKLDLDMERIRAERPRVVALIRQHAES